MSKDILVVDDEPELVKALEIRLKSSGYNVSVAYNGEEGLMKVKAQRPDLIILDILMPKMSGSVLAGILKEDLNLKDIPIIFLTCLAEGVTENPKGFIEAVIFFWPSLLIQQN